MSFLDEIFKILEWAAGEASSSARRENNQLRNLERNHPDMTAAQREKIENRRMELEEIQMNARETRAEMKERIKESKQSKYE